MRIIQEGEISIGVDRIGGTPPAGAGCSIQNRPVGGLADHDVRNAMIQDRLIRLKLSFDRKVRHPLLHAGCRQWTRSDAEAWPFAGGHCGGLVANPKTLLRSD